MSNSGSKNTIEMAAALYKIKDLVCSYDGSTPVLKIDQLDLEIGTQTVFVGKSGAGKSTLLETLGLMNRTIAKGDIQFCPEEGVSLSMKELWDDESELARIRNRYYSFIFQNTNLMNNFTAYENACIPQLLQGVSLPKAMTVVREAMNRVGIGEISEADRVTQLSGGQRQRLAFVRAVTPDFTVLFGDEPTGNLDEVNAQELMRYIDSDVHQKKRSSILVSHNIDLSMTFADQIILLMKDGQDSFGQVNEESVFTARQEKGQKTWFNQKGEEVKEMRNHLLQNLM